MECSGIRGAIDVFPDSAVCNGRPGTIVRAVETYTYMRPCLGEIVSGDCAVVSRNEDGLLLAVADVLGHGEEAHPLASRIEAFLKAAVCSDVAALMVQFDDDLKGSRGAAVGLAHVASGSDILSYCSIGNTRLTKYGGDQIRLVAQDGIVGGNMRTPRTQRLKLSAGDVVVMTSDGVSERINLSDYPPLLSESAASIAHQVVRRFGKDYDDATCLVLTVS